MLLKYEDGYSGTITMMITSQDDGYNDGDHGGDDDDDGDDDDKIKKRHLPAVSAKPEVTLRALSH